MKVHYTRLFALSLLVGLFAGIFGTAFRWCLQKAMIMREFMFQHDKPILFHICILIGMWLVAMFVYWLTTKIPLIGGSGIPQSRGVIFGRFVFKSPWTQFIGKFIGSLSAIGMGLSLGREGPSVEIGTLGATMISKRFKATPTETRYLCSAGAGAGLAAAFTAPIASVIFLIEDTLGWVSLRVALPALLTCIISGFCAREVFAENVYLTVPTIAPDINVWGMLVILAGLAVLGTIFGKFFNVSLFKLKALYKNLRVPVGIKLFVVVGITYIAGMLIIDLTSGGETELIKQALSNDGNVWWLFGMVVIKILFTAISYSTGLCGSLLLPLVVLGGLLGKAYALLLIQLGIIGAESAGFFTIIGMSIMFISVVRAPISSMMLILEMTGQYTVFYPMIIAGTLTYLFGQYAGIKPVYHKLYDLMINANKGNYTEMIKAQFGVSQDSVLIGKSIVDIQLPAHSNIVAINRDELTSVALTPSTIIQLGDLITVEVPEKEYEPIFKVLRTLTNE